MLQEPVASERGRYRTLSLRLGPLAHVGIAYQAKGVHAGELAGCHPHEVSAIILTLMGEHSAAVLDRLFAAVSDPTRRAILARLAESDARVTDVAGGFPISLNSTSKHIRVLEQAGLVRRSVRGREHTLSLDAAPLAEAAGWIDYYRGFWSDQLASLDAFVATRSNTERSS